MKEANKSVGVQFSSLKDLLKRQVLKKTSAIHSDCAHLLHSEYKFTIWLCLSAPVTEKNRHKKSSIPAIHALNAKGRRRKLPWLKMTIRTQ